MAGGTGLLARDLDGNGTIDNGTELFGDQAASGIANGFDKLALLDTNGDGHISSADLSFADLRVWLDDGNARTESGELKTLAELGITDIDLRYDAANVAVAGNTLKQLSTFTINGETRQVADAWFGADTARTVYDGPETRDPATVLMPDLHGYGVMKDLGLAM